MLLCLSVSNLFTYSLNRFLWQVYLIPKEDALSDILYSTEKRCGDKRVLGFTTQDIRAIYFFSAGSLGKTPRISLKFSLVNEIKRKEDSGGKGDIKR